MIDPLDDFEGSGFSFFEFLSMFPEDKLNDDDQREHEEQFGESGPFGFYYRGFVQYGPNGEPLIYYVAPGQTGGE